MPSRRVARSAKHYFSASSAALARARPAEASRALLDFAAAARGAPKDYTMTVWPADKVERRAVAALIPYARNARTHSPEQVGRRRG
jgi:hypothetical protein